MQLIKNTFEPKGITIKLLNKYEDVIKLSQVKIKKPSDALPDLNTEQKKKLINLTIGYKASAIAEALLELI